MMMDADMAHAAQLMDKATAKKPRIYAATTKETDATLIARLRENLEHIAGQLVERTAQLAEAKRRIEDEMQITALAANARVHRMADRKPWINWISAAHFVVGGLIGAVLL